MSRKIDLSKATIGSPTPCSIALVDLIRTMERIDALYAKANALPADVDLSDEDDKLLSQLERRRSGLEDELKREIADKLHIDAAILQEAVTFV